MTSVQTSMENDTRGARSESVQHRISYSVEIFGSLRNFLALVSITNSGAILRVDPLLSGAAGAALLHFF